MARISAVVGLAIYGAAATYIEVTKGFEYIYYLRIPFFGLLTALYIQVIIFLNLKMRKLVGDFNMEIKSINKQFIVFLIAYITRIAFWTMQVITDGGLSNFYGCVLVSLIQILWNILPIFYSVYQHHQVFRKLVKKQQKLQLESPEIQRVKSTVSIEKYATSHADAIYLNKQSINTQSIESSYERVSSEASD